MRPGLQPECLHCQLVFLMTAMDTNLQDPDRVEYAGATTAALGSLLIATAVGYSVECGKEREFGDTWNTALSVFQEAVRRIVNQGAPNWTVFALEPSVRSLLEPEDDVRMRFEQLLQTDSYRIWTGDYD